LQQEPSIITAIAIHGSGLVIRKSSNRKYGVPVPLIMSCTSKRSSAGKSAIAEYASRTTNATTGAEYSPPKTTEAKNAIAKTSVPPTVHNKLNCIAWVHG